MQRVSALLPSWNGLKSKETHNTLKKRPASLEKAPGWSDKSATERLRKAAAGHTTPGSSRSGRELYWPASLDRECDKAARILKSFCTDGFLAQDEATARNTTSQPSTPKLITRKIPPRIIQDAVGLAIFSCMRSGLWMSGSGGSGILVARKADGTWSEPSGILLHTSAVGFVLGVDIYDCVLVINSVPILEMFASPRVTLGSDVSLTVGPLHSSDAAEQTVGRRELDNSVLTYLKARGKFQAVRLDGSLVAERANENERFYRGHVHVLDVLAGNVTKDIPEIRPLFEVIKAAEGRTDFDAPLLELLSQQPAPGDAVIETPIASPQSPQSASFGVPDEDDPDPFGVIALEMAGLEIREAGSRLRPTSSQFELQPSPTSPIFGFNRQSIDTALSRSNRGSYMSTRTQATMVTDAGTQTDGANTPHTTASPSPTDDGDDVVVADKTPVINEPEETTDLDLREIDMSAVRHLASRPSESDLDASAASAPEEETVVRVDSSTETDAAEDERDEDADDEDEDEEGDGDEELVIYEVATAAQPTRPAILSTKVAQVIQAKGALVTIGRRAPPPLPLRSPARVSRASKSDLGDVSGLKSPLRSSMLSTASHPTDSGAGEEPAPVSPEPDSFETAPWTATADDNVSPIEADSDYHSLQQPFEFPDVCQESTVSLESQSQTLSPPHASSGEDSLCEPQTPKPADDIQVGTKPFREAEKGDQQLDIGKGPIHATYIRS